MSEPLAERKAEPVPESVVLPESVAFPGTNADPVALAEKLLEREA